MEGTEVGSLNGLENRSAAKTAIVRSDYLPPFTWDCKSASKYDFRRISSIVQRSVRAQWICYRSKILNFSLNPSKGYLTAKQGLR